MRDGVKKQAENNAEGSKVGVAAVHRALEVLTVFRETDAPLALTEISKRTGLYKSTVLRLLSSLEEYGFIRRLSDKRFRLGSRVIHLSRIYQQMFRLEEIVRPVLKELVQITTESSTFFQREGKSRICLFREHSMHTLRDHVHEGHVLPLNKGAAGRVLTEFSSIRSNCIPPALAEQLPFVSYDELANGTYGAAVPIFGSDGTLIGALAISGPLSRLNPSSEAQFKEALTKSGDYLCAELGAPQ